MSSIRSLTLFALAAALAAPLASADAQGFMDRLKKKAEEAAKRRVEERVDQRAGEAADKALDKTEGGLKCVFTDETCIARAKSAGEDVVLVDESGATVDETGAPVAADAGPAASSDFVPGSRVILAEDFSGDVVGDFPRRFELTDGNMEVVEWQGRRFLRGTSVLNEFSIPLPETLPERFTLEFEYRGMGGRYLEIRFTDERDDAAYSRVALGAWAGGIDGGGVRSQGQPAGDPYRYKGKVFPVRVMADGRYVKVYMGDTRVANAPNATLGRAKRIHFALPADEQEPALIGSIRIAAGGRDLYDALEADGRVTAEGILFDSGSDRIRAESAPALEAIARLLAAHPELRLTIEGHTDDVGAAAANQALSERRAAAVKAYLVASHGIDAGRLTSAGYGASRPAAPNDTPDGRRKNRRVELVRN